MSDEINSTVEGETSEGVEMDQETVSLSDVIQNEQKLIDDATAVLGASDDKNCTYSEGYLKRQALYSCLTCIPEAKTDVTKSGGVCLACCYCCHEGHELIELYTKRNFRCDCGNSKFGSGVCNLESNKEEVNELNHYNHNFSGVYCVCCRPFPDPEDTIADEMIQCVICEDWYHVRHLGVELATSYSEMTCESCIRKHEFLLHYDSLTVGASLDESKEVDVEDTTEQSGPSTASAVIECKKPKNKSSNICTKFWVEVDWRKSLCECVDCLKLYEEEEVKFLLDPQDTVQTYEEKGKAKVEESGIRQQENEMKFLNSLNRVPLLEAIAGYNDFKSNLVEFLKKFAENKKVVREEDVREFFSGLDANKKQKLDIPYNCR